MRDRDLYENAVDELAAATAELNDLYALITDLRNELAAEQQAHERTRAAAELKMQRLRIADDQIAATEATLEARDREVGAYRKALERLNSFSPHDIPRDAQRIILAALATTPPSTTGAPEDA